MFTVIGVLIGGFLGYLASGFIPGLEPLKDTAKQGITKGVELCGGLLTNLTKSFGQGPLINIGIMILAGLLLLWLVGFFNGILIGFVGGLIYSEEVGRLPFVSGIADTVRQKIGNKKVSDE